MKSLSGVLLITLGATLALVPSSGWTQQAAPTLEKKAASPEASARQKNIDEYIRLLRFDVRQQKAEMMGVMMQLSAADAAKFWPIYDEYDAELSLS